MLKYFVRGGGGGLLERVCKLRYKGVQMLDQKGLFSFFYSLGQNCMGTFQIGK